ncbi:MAG: malate synthase G [Acidobacteriota bacterium]
MSDRIQAFGLQVAPELYDFVNGEVLPKIELEAEEFWSGFAQIVQTMAPRNRELLAKRDELQDQLDEWHRDHEPGKVDAGAYKSYLQEIGYLQPEGEDFQVEVENVDPEIASISGPQLVVPVSNARFCINAANARWQSLYDALYGTDVIPEGEGTEKGTSYNPARGKLVEQYAERFLDATAPLTGGSYSDVTEYRITEASPHALEVVFRDGSTGGLEDASLFAGYAGRRNGLEGVLLCHNGLHVEIQIDRQHPVGAEHRAGVKDVVLESAVTTIQDCEDSVAAVDAEDKVGVYRNWLGLMMGDLQESFLKGGREITRSLEADRHYTAADGADLVLPGRSLMLVRNVGHLMTNPAVLTESGDEVPEGILDAVITSAIGKCDLDGAGALPNSRSGSIYIVKPKMHGPEEAAFTVDLFAAAEKLLGLPENAVKVGIMDEERRTTLNLKECIRAAKNRVIFINTGFLDRTGDEIHTSMEAGPMIPKGEIKNATWLNAYEDWNVDLGIRTGLYKTGQIGKGMWAMPDEMAAMVEAKTGHPQSGANCAWVPSPTAAALHAMHYHQIDVEARQAELASREQASVDDLLKIPVAPAPPEPPSPQELQRELDNNAQGILGYVVRWVDQGIGCSKVPDINDVGLMEDRATLRISSQHIANWLRHGFTSREQVQETFERMAKVVDEQNAGDKNYRPMAPDTANNIAFQASLDLVFQGTALPNGYTEPVLHARRLELKARQG